eukprot:g69991.t1
MSLRVVSLDFLILPFPLLLVLHFILLLLPFLSTTRLTRTTRLLCSLLLLRTRNVWINMQGAGSQVVLRRGGLAFCFSMRQVNLAAVPKARILSVERWRRCP